MSDVLDPLHRFMEDGDEIDGDDAHAIVEYVERLTRELAEAREAFHDATRLRVRIQQARIKAEDERDAARQARYLDRTRAMKCSHCDGTGRKE